MESLDETHRESVRKMSTERIQGRLMKGGLHEDEIYEMSRSDLMEKLATVMLNAGADPVASTMPTPSAEAQVRLLELQAQREQMQLQLKILQEEREQRDKELQAQCEQREQQLQTQR